jgi:hypothetical protein
MALIAVAADKGSPGVTTASLAFAAVWPRPVLLAELDAAGGDLFYRLPAADGGRLDPQRGLLTLAVAARRGIQPHQVWPHTQKLRCGLDILTGLVNAEQAGGLQSLWGDVGTVLADIAEADVIADCGRLGADGPFYDLLARAAAVVLVTRVTLEDMVRLRDRVIAVATGLADRGLARVQVGVVVVADHRRFKRSLAEAAQVLAQSGAPGRVLGGLAYEPASAAMLRGQWGTKLDRSLLIRTSRALAARIVWALPPLGVAEGPGQPRRAAPPWEAEPPAAATAHRARTDATGLAKAAPGTAPGAAARPAPEPRAAEPRAAAPRVAAAPAQGTSRPGSPGSPGPAVPRERDTRRHPGGPGGAGTGGNGAGREHRGSGAVIRGPFEPLPADEPPAVPLDRAGHGTGPRVVLPDRPANDAVGIAVWPLPATGSASRNGHHADSATAG